MNGPSIHLSWNELACKDGTPYPAEWRNSRAVILADVFEVIRKICGDRPIIVTSAFRTSEYNRKINGARKSQHIQGRALDLKPPKGITIKRFYNIIRGIADDLPIGIGGIGKYKTFIHVDIRPTTKLVVWNGSGIKDDN